MRDVEVVRLGGGWRYAVVALIAVGAGVALTAWLL
jgi:ubiquinone biosynthesis protein